MTLQWEKKDRIWSKKRRLIADRALRHYGETIEHQYRELIAVRNLKKMGLNELGGRQPLEVLKIIDAIGNIRFFVEDILEGRDYEYSHCSNLISAAVQLDMAAYLVDEEECPEGSYSILKNMALVSLAIAETFPLTADGKMTTSDFIKMRLEVFDAAENKDHFQENGTLIATLLKEMKNGCESLQTLQRHLSGETVCA